MSDDCIFATTARLAAEVYPTILQLDLYRYLLGAGGTFLVINMLLAGWLARRKIRADKPDRRQMAREMLASLRTVLIFSLVGFSMVVADEIGLLDLYENPAERGWPYFLLNVLVLIVGHDAWFYWTHRFMHRPRLFRWFHLLHHRSYNPSPWTSYAFDASEALVNAIYLPLAVLAMPTSALAGFVFMAHMMLRNAVGHCGYEVFPARPNGRPLFDWMTTVTHHDLHHARARTNFGLYFTFWDRVMGTEDPTYHGAFARAVGRTLARGAGDGMHEPARQVTR